MFALIKKKNKSETLIKKCIATKPFSSGTPPTLTLTPPLLMLSLASAYHLLPYLSLTSYLCPWCYTLTSYLCPWCLPLGMPHYMAFSAMFSATKILLSAQGSVQM